MRELGSVGPGPGDGGEADRLGINSYLELIGGENRERESQEARLPELTAQPWRISDIKSKISKTTDSQMGSKTAVKIGKLGSFAFKGAKAEKQPKESSVEVNTNKIKEMFEDNARMGSKRTVSELNLGPAVRKKKVVIDPLQQQAILPAVRRRDSAKTKAWSHKLASYWSNKGPKKDNESNHSKQKMETLPSHAKRSPEEEEAWKSIEDPEERKRAILLKHGFKPRDPVKEAERERELDIDAELNTIPNHVLHDELLYRKYMERELGFQFSRIPDSQVGRLTVESRHLKLIFQAPPAPLLFWPTKRNYEKLTNLLSSLSFPYQFQVPILWQIYVPELMYQKLPPSRAPARAPCPHPRRARKRAVIPRAACSTSSVR